MRKQVTADQIKAVRCNTDEAETSILMERQNAVAKIWSSDNIFITKIKRCMSANPEKYVCYEGSKDDQGNITGYFFECPKSLISLRKKSKEVHLTEEQKTRAAERLNNARKATNKGE